MLAKWRMRLFWALVLAIVTAWGVMSYLQSVKETEAVVMAVREIPARAEITAEMLTVVEVHRADRERFASNSFRAISEVVGRHTRRRIESGEVLRNRTSDLTSPGEVRSGGAPREGALADFIPANTRAVMLKLDKQAVLGQHVRAGDRVDLIFTSKSDSTGGVYSSLILQQVTVLALQHPAEDAPDEDVLTTVLVSPEQAVDLTLAKRTGSVDLALSPPDAGDPVPNRTVSPLKFAGQTAIPPGKAEPENSAKP